MCIELGLVTGQFNFLIYEGYKIVPMYCIVYGKNTQQDMFILQINIELFFWLTSLVCLWFLLVLYNVSWKHDAKNFGFFERYDVGCRSQRGTLFTAHILMSLASVAVQAEAELQRCMSLW